ncbi:hypothetical protein FHQ28_08665 [Pasteurellaceae bacterium USgator11]|nr:hypothetical protein FHQ20_10105 [Pasteurellaceae bacterium USgator41]TNG98693.1 hypothetical protein FHQ24_07875 [Pasteurellaceae bacterium UScroc31]TNH00060.1 hypothetical protein FHQ28_08665 [Pasteurellaceae bacterium USgator11]
MNSFENKLGRLKSELNMLNADDKDIAEILGMQGKAFSARKKRDSFPEKELFALHAKRPDLNLNVNYILAGTRKVKEKRITLSEIGGRIQEERVACEYSLSDFAQKMGIDDAQQARIESNQEIPDFEYLLHLAKIRFDVSYILFGNISERPKNSLSGTTFIEMMEHIKTAKNDDELDVLLAYRTANEKGKLALRSVAEAVRNDEMEI